MKRLLFLIILCVAPLSSARMFADNPEDYPESDYNESYYYDVYFNQVAENYDPEPEPIGEPDKLKRLPSRRIYGSISKAGGLKIDGVNISEIYLFEICDADGVCIGAFCDANDFVQAVFSYHGNMELRLHTAKHILLGNI